MADALERAGTGKLVEFPKSMLEGEAAIGAASFLCFLRDCITSSPKDTWTRVDLLVLLEVTSRDKQIFPSGIGTLLYSMEHDEESLDQDADGDAA